jgi:hypothetical protein
MEMEISRGSPFGCKLGAFSTRGAQSETCRNVPPGRANVARQRARLFKIPKMGCETRCGLVEVLCVIDKTRPVHSLRLMNRAAQSAMFAMWMRCALAEVRAYTCFSLS